MSVKNPDFLNTLKHLEELEGKNYEWYNLFWNI
jgi:hypothetical protein